MKLHCLFPFSLDFEFFIVTVQFLCYSVNMCDRHV